MSREAVSSLIQKRTLALNNHDVPALSAFYSIDCTVQSPLAAGTVQGRQAIARVYESLFAAFPDIIYSPDTLVIDGDMAASSGWLSGTYTGGFVNLPPSGNPVRLLAVTFSKVVDGEIVFERRVYDFTGMLVQAGVLKAQSA